MALRYETGIATLTQFIVMTLLNFANAISSSVTGCTNGGNDCVSNVILSLLFFLLITAWFGFLGMLGYAAQERRNPRLAQILLAAEGAVAMVSLFNARHFPDLLGLLTSLIDFGLAAWVAWLAFRLMRARGGRIVTASSRARKRPGKTT